MLSTRVLFTAAFTASLLAAPAPHAITRCKAKTLEDGTFAVSAREITGTPRWGLRYDAETTPLDDTVSCVADGKASDCALAPIGMPERTELPPSCTVYLTDDGTERWALTSIGGSGSCVAA